MEGRECRNLLDLPPELTSSILHRLGAIEILENAQKVCRSWREVCREPSMWQIIDMNNMGILRSINYDLQIMCRHAIDRSRGGLVDINIGNFRNDNLLQYIADSSSNLRCLRLARGYSITDEGLAEALVKLPLLEDLEVSYSSLSRDSLKVIGRSCPNLKTFKLNNPGFRRLCIFEYDEDALAIAENMRGLCHLRLFGHGLTESGLNAILENRLHLEHLDLRQCFNIELVGNLEKRCTEKIEVVRLPMIQLLTTHLMQQLLIWIGRKMNTHLMMPSMTLMVLVTFITLTSMTTTIISFIRHELADDFLPFLGMFVVPVDVCCLVVTGIWLFYHRNRTKPDIFSSLISLITG